MELKHCSCRSGVPDIFCPFFERGVDILVETLVLKSYTETNDEQR